MMHGDQRRISDHTSHTSCSLPSSQTPSKPSSHAHFPHIQGGQRKDTGLWMQFCHLAEIPHTPVVVQVYPDLRASVCHTLCLSVISNLLPYDYYHYYCLPWFGLFSTTWLPCICSDNDGYSCDNEDSADKDIDYIHYIYIYPTVEN